MERAHKYKYYYDEPHIRGYNAVGKLRDRGEESDSSSTDDSGSEERQTRLIS